MSLKSLKTVGILILLVNLVACGSVDSDSAERDSETGKVLISRNYNFTYSEASDSVMFSANFREAGRMFSSKSIRLVGVSQLSVDGKKIEDRGVKDEKDGGELVSLYAGLLFPPFWMFLGDNSYSNYSKALDYKDTYDVAFVDPEGERHNDFVSIQRSEFFMPQQAFKGENLTIEYSDSSTYSRVSCSVQGKIIEEKQVTVVDSDGNETKELKTQTVHKSKSFLGDAGEVVIPSDFFEELDSNKISIECEASRSRKLTSGFGGTIHVSSKSRSKSYNLR